MDLKKEAQQRSCFRDILFELAKSQVLLQDGYERVGMYKRLEALYDAETPEKRFRHFYSDIFSVLTQIQQNPQLGSIDVLGQNMEVIRNGYNPQNKAPDGKRTIDVSDAINKLYDHVSLDIARITYSDAADRRISGDAAMEKVQSRLRSMESELQQAQDINRDFEATKQKLVMVEDKLKDSQKEYISILGIFAAVVLAFTGGIAFSTSVLNNIAQASVYRTVFVSLVIGLVLVNVLFGLFYYVNCLVNKDKKIQPLVISNLVIVTLLALTFAAWNCGWVENRDNRINRRENAFVEELRGSDETPDREETVLPE